MGLNVQEKAIEICLKQANKNVKAGFNPFVGVLYPSHLAKIPFKNRAAQNIVMAFDRVIQDSDPTAHGVLLAIRMACKSMKCVGLEGFTLVTITYPCPMCLGAIELAKIDEIIYFISYTTVSEFERIKYRESLFKRFGCKEEFYRRIQRRDFPSHLDKRYEEVALELYVKWISAKKGIRK